MNTEFLYKYATGAGDTCPVAFSIQARLMLNSENIGLYKAVTKSGFEYYVWIDKNAEHLGSNRVSAFTLPAEKLGEVNQQTVSYKYIAPNEVFAYNGDVYYLHGTPFGDRYVVIRKMTAFMHEDIAVKIATNGDIKRASNVFVSNFYIFQDSVRSYCFTAWGVVIEDGAFYLPIFADDLHFFEENVPDDYIRREIDSNAHFTHHKRCYGLQHDVNKKLFVEEICGFKTPVQQKLNTSQKARIIEFNKKRGQ